MANGSNNARFLSKIDSKSKSMILENIAKHYGISTQEAFSEVTDSEAEHLLDYMTEPARSAASVLMQKHGLRGFSRPGAKDMMGTNKRIIRARGHEFLAEDEGNRTRISIKIDGAWEHAATVNTDNQTATEWIEANAKPGDPSRWLPSAFSRPGAKAKFKVEDRFYFGKGRKERFSDDAKQIADTILKQLGGGRFIAMTGAKNLAFMSNPPGLHMSLGRGTKDGIKYLRVNYDRGSDTYTMIFANKSGGTVKSVSHVYADSLQRVFTSTTGFDTHL